MFFFNNSIHTKYVNLTAENMLLHHVEIRRPLMKRLALCTWLAVVGILCINMSDPNSSLDGKVKPRINFYGTLITKHNKTYNVEYITIGHLIKDIKVFELPPESTAFSAPTPSSPSQEQHFEKIYTLEEDPRSDVKSFLDLSTIKKIVVPHPRIVWRYKPKKKHYIHYFTQIDVYSNDVNLTKNSYLINLEREIQFNQILTSGSIDKHGTFPSIKEVSIEGYRYKHKSPQKKSESSIDTPPKAAYRPLRQIRQA